MLRVASPTRPIARKVGNIIESPIGAPMMNRPLVPSDIPRMRAAAQRESMRSLVRAVWAMGASVIDKSMYASDHSRKAWGNDPDIERLIKAAVAPADSTSGLLGYSQILLKSLVPISAAAALVDQVGGLSWPPGVGNLLVPAINMTGLAAFIGEGAPVPVPQGLSSKVTLQPFKLALLSVLSSELFRYTASEQLIERALTESIGYSLDGLMLSTNAAVAGISPPGLLHGVAPLTPTPLTGGAAVQIMYADLSALAGAVAMVAGNDEEGVSFIMAAKQAVFARLRLTDVSYPIFASAALAPGTVIAIASRALAFVSRDPRFETTKQSVVHMESANPLPIGTPGSPPTVAAPATSLWQTDSIGIRFIWPLNYTMRDVRGISYMSPVNW
jgi:hypothetical protein